MWYRVAAEPREKGSSIRFEIVVRLPSKSDSGQPAGSAVSVSQLWGIGYFRQDVSSSDPVCSSDFTTLPFVAANDEIWAAGGWRGVVDHSSSCGCRTLPGQWTGLRNEMLDRGTALPHSRIPRGPMSELQLSRSWRPGERSGARWLPRPVSAMVSHPIMAFGGRNCCECHLRKDETGGGGSGAPLRPSAFSLYDMRVGCHRVFGVACRLSPVACRLSSCRKTW